MMLPYCVSVSQQNNKKHGSSLICSTVPGAVPSGRNVSSLRTQGSHQVHSYSSASVCVCVISRSVSHQISYGHKRRCAFLLYIIKHAEIDITTIVNSITGVLTEHRGEKKSVCKAKRFPQIGY